MIENLIVFKDSETRKVLENMGFKINENGEVLNEYGEKMRCPHCGEPITLENVGGIFPGSKILVCDHLGCILEELDNKKFIEKIESL